jgi:hypothetical protein
VWKKLYAFLKSAVVKVGFMVWQNFPEEMSLASAVLWTIVGKTSVVN